MNKMVISLVIEGKKEDLNEIKGTIISTASEALVSVTTNMIEEKKCSDTESVLPKRLQLIMANSIYGAYPSEDQMKRVKEALNAIYGKDAFK